MENKDGITINLTKPTIRQAFFSIILSLFYVIFMWGFFKKGFYAFGFNAFLFYGAFFAFLIYNLKERGNLIKNDLAWIIPFALMIASFLFFDNPFVKVINIFVMPFLFAFFYNLATFKNKLTAFWNKDLIFKVIEKIIYFFDKINDACAHYVLLLGLKGSGKRSVFLRILAGILILFFISFAVIIPLLSSVDPLFAGKIKYVYDLVKKIFDTAFFMKVVVFIIMSVAMLAVFFAWGEKYDYQEKDKKEKKSDPIITTIVIGGIFLLYILFITIQFNRMWSGALPLDFETAVGLVKSGFWQLFMLSVVNVLIYLSSFRKGGSSVQAVLSLFTISSLLLVFSAGWRVWLYAYNYGLSYEKFYALYTVIYCFILFVILLSAFLVKKKINFLKIFVFLFLWMFSITTIMPFESIVFNTNLQLSKKPNSRIKLIELQMFSPDILTQVKKEVSARVLSAEEWQNWIDSREERINGKAWYELNAVNLQANN